MTNMKKLRIILAVIVCKVSTKLLRMLGRGGTDFPGRLALKVCPNLLYELSKNVKTVIVVGTNGKTTTCRMLEQGIVSAGETCISNKSGANLLGGITACFGERAAISGACKYRYAVIECDEGHFRLVSKQLKPETVVVTNLFRDQLDRYGDISHTLEILADGIKNIPDAVLCINADCSMTATLRDRFENRVFSFGVDVPLYKETVSEISDALYCPKCGSVYVYDYMTFGHLGGFRCTGCGYCRISPDCAAKQAVSADADGYDIIMSIEGDQFPARVGLPGAYNIYNACACAAALAVMGFNRAVILSAIGDFKCGFGRMEKFDIGSGDVRMILVKNPAGCNQVLSYLINSGRSNYFVIGLNDLANDGRDVSWIYDVEYERLFESKACVSGILVFGRRSEEMALRLKYAGFDEDFIQSEKAIDRVIDLIAQRSEPVCIMPNYTAMMALRGRIAKRYGLKNFWE